MDCREKRFCFVNMERVHFYHASDSAEYKIMKKSHKTLYFVTRLQLQVNIFSHSLCGLCQRSQI